MYALYSAVLGVGLLAYLPAFLLRRRRAGYSRNLAQRLGRLGEGLPPEPPFRPPAASELVPACAPVVVPAPADVAPPFITPKVSAPLSRRVQQIAPANGSSSQGNEWRRERAFISTKQCPRGVTEPLASDMTST